MHSTDLDLDYSPDIHKVLMIEDNHDIRNLMEDLVTILGFDARVAPDGIIGLDMARRYKPNVIICDIGLPDMNGYEVARLIRGDSSLKNTYLIAMSGYGCADDIEKSLAAGFDQHLVKPVELSTLDRLLNQAVKAINES
ncbi:MAG: response regulator [Saccharofermentanales bacterium]